MYGDNKYLQGEAKHTNRSPEIGGGTGGASLCNNINITSVSDCQLWKGKLLEIWMVDSGKGRVWREEESQQGMEGPPPKVEEHFPEQPERRDHLPNQPFSPEN